MTELSALLANTGVANLGLGQLAMIGVCGLLLYLAIAKEFEPLLLLPIGFGGILANIPVAGIAGPDGFLGIIYEAGVANGLFPLLIFMGVGAVDGNTAARRVRGRGEGGVGGDDGEAVELGEL